MEINRNELYLGDCLEVMEFISDESVDCIVTDPPYKITSGGCTVTPNKNEPKGIFNRRDKRKDWADNARKGKMFNHNEIEFEDWVPHIYRVLKNGTHAYIMTNDRNMHELLTICKHNKLRLVNILAWKKNNVTPNRYYMKNLEFIVMVRKGKAKTINNPGSKQCIEVDNIIGGKLHPTEKPVKVMEILISNSTNPGEVVLDPFIGSGTTAIACINTGRQYIGIEKDEEYYEIAKKRISDRLKEKEIEDRKVKFEI